MGFNSVFKGLMCFTFYNPGSIYCDIDLETQLNKVLTLLIVIHFSNTFLYKNILYSVYKFK